MTATRGAARLATCECSSTSGGHAVYAHTRVIELAVTRFASSSELTTVPGMPRPLQGIRVVDLTIERGELCGRLLGDLGAEVIRVEPPGGSPSRRLPPLHGDHSLFFAFRNAGKLGVALDPTSERLHDLLACSDVVIDSAEPGSRPGTEVDDLAARHPHLVCLSITAYGRTGPYAGRDVPDAVLEATGGMAFKAGTPEREPLIPPGNIADDTGSMIGAFAALCALWQ